MKTSLDFLLSFSHNESIRRTHHFHSHILTFFHHHECYTSPVHHCFHLVSSNDPSIFILAPSNLFGICQPEGSHKAETRSCHPHASTPSRAFNGVCMRLNQVSDSDLSGPVPPGHWPSLNHTYCFCALFLTL